jgi:hypothetical protein
LDIAVDDATEPSALRTIKVAQKAKDVLVEPVLLLMYKVRGFVIVAPGVQVSQGLEGNVALTNSKSPDVHELAEGKVCAIDFVETKAKKTKQQTFKKRNK